MCAAFYNLARLHRMQGGERPCKASSSTAWSRWYWQQVPVSLSSSCIFFFFYPLLIEKTYGMQNVLYFGNLLWWKLNSIAVTFRFCVSVPDSSSVLSNKKKYGLCLEIKFCNCKCSATNKSTSCKKWEGGTLERSDFVSTVAFYMCRPSKSHMNIQSKRFVMHFVWVLWCCCWSFSV